MADVDRQRIKSVYSQIKGYLTALPEMSGGFNAPISAVQNYNSLLVQLTELTRSSYDNYNISEGRNTFNGYGYDINEVRMSMSAVTQRLNDDFGFEREADRSAIPLVITVNQNQQMSVTVVNLQQLIDEQQDEEIKELLRDLQSATFTKDVNQSKGVLKDLADKSWEVFLRALPYILEHWGRH